MKKRIGILIIMILSMAALLHIKIVGNSYFFKRYAISDSTRLSIDSTRHEMELEGLEDHLKGKCYKSIGAASGASVGSVSSGLSDYSVETITVDEKLDLKEADESPIKLDELSPETNTAGKMTAGEWSDIDNWSFWTSLFEKEKFKADLKTWDIEPGSCKKVKVLSTSGKPINGARLNGYDSEGTRVFSIPTDAKGEVAFVSGGWKFDQQLSITKVRVQCNDAEYEPVFSKGNQETTIKVLNPAPTNLNLEIGFIVDATGSMSDEMEFLKRELDDVVGKVHSIKKEVKIKTGCVFYKDKFDDFVTEVSPLSTELVKTHSFIKAHYAGGGGDFPEAVESGLQTSLDKLGWSEDNSIKIAFLILDAPPHNNPENKEKIKALTREYAARGIRIVPITASGIDKSTEFLMRQMSILTGGTYVFITNHSGIGNNHIEPSIGKYKVEFLNDLMVRVISKYI